MVTIVVFALGSRRERSQSSWNASLIPLRGHWFTCSIFVFPSNSVSSTTAPEANWNHPPTCSAPARCWVQRRVLTKKVCKNPSKSPFRRALFGRWRQVFTRVFRSRKRRFAIPSPAGKAEHDHVRRTLNASSLLFLSVLFHAVLL